MSDTAKSELQAASTGRVVRIDTATHAAAPTDGPAGTAPDIVTSPVTPGGTPTMGLMLLLKLATFGGAPTFGATGATVIVWARNPVTFQWGASASFVTPGAEWISTFDWDGGELYFQFSAGVTVNGKVDISVVEQ